MEIGHKIIKNNDWALGKGYEWYNIALNNAANAFGWLKQDSVSNPPLCGVPLLEGRELGQRGAHRITRRGTGDAPRHCLAGAGACLKHTLHSQLKHRYSQLEQVFPNKTQGFPNKNAFPNKTHAFPYTTHAFPNKTHAFPHIIHTFPNTNSCIPIYKTCIPK